MPGTFEQGAKLMQPQMPEGAPRAANPGMGGGPRAYAPGATSAYQGPQYPSARQMVPPSDGPPPSQGAQGTSPAAPGAPVSSIPVTPGGPNPMAQMQQAQDFAQRLVSLLMQKNQQRMRG